MTFDIRFTVIAPGTGEEIKLIINLEAQNDYNPGYPLLKRGVFPLPLTGQLSIASLTEYKCALHTLQGGTKMRHEQKTTLKITRIVGTTSSGKDSFSFLNLPHCRELLPLGEFPKVNG